MNDDILIKLKLLVERAVRPVRASIPRKRQMREEFLAHLMAIYEEELEKHREEQLAFENAKERFGNPAELSRELQNSVPAWNRIQGILQHRMQFATGESPLHFAAKHTSVQFGATIILLAIVVPLGILARISAHRPPEIAMIFQIVLAMSAVEAFFAFTLMFLGTTVCRAFQGYDAKRRVQTMAFCCLASLFVLPMMVLMIYGCLWLSVPNSRLLLACSIAPAMPVLILLMGRVLANEVRADAEWSRLEIEKWQTPSA